VPVEGELEEKGKNVSVEEVDFSATRGLADGSNSGKHLTEVKKAGVEFKNFRLGAKNNSKRKRELAIGWENSTRKTRFFSNLTGSIRERGKESRKGMSRQKNLKPLESNSKSFRRWGRGRNS